MIIDIIGSIDKLIQKNQSILTKINRFISAEYSNLIQNTVTRKTKVSEFVNVKTGRKDSNESSLDGIYPFFTCGKVPLKINSYSFDTEAITIAGNGGSLGHMEYYRGKFDAYQRTYVITTSKYFNYIFEVYKGEISSLINKSRGSAIKYFTKSMLEEFEIYMYSKKLMDTFEVNTSFLRTQNQVIKSEIQLLEKLKTLQLKKYFD